MSNTPPNTLTPPASNSPANTGPTQRAVSGSLKDRIAKFNNPSAAPLVPTHAFGTAGPNQPSTSASRGLVGNRIPSVTSGSGLPSFLNGSGSGRKVSENRGLIGNRIPSVAGVGKTARSASPAGSVDSSTASASGPAGSSASPLTSRSSSPPSSPHDRDPLNLLGSTLHDNGGPGAATPSSTRAEVGEDLTALSAPTTPIQQPVDIPRNDADPAQYDLVLPNLKRMVEESSLNPSGPSLGGSSKASQFAEEGGSETQQEKMLQDVSGVSTPMGTPRAERKELEGSARGEGSVVGDGEGRRDEDMEQVSDRLKGLEVGGQEEGGAVQDAGDIAKSTLTQKGQAATGKQDPEDIAESTSAQTSRAETEKQGTVEDDRRAGHEITEQVGTVQEDGDVDMSDPNKASDLADLKAGRLSHSDHQTVHADHVNPVNNAAETAFVQELSETTSRPQDENIEIETTETRPEAAPKVDNTESAVENGDAENVQSAPQAAVHAHNDPSRGPEAWKAENDHADEIGPNREDVAQKRSEESGNELVTNEAPTGNYDTTGRVAGDNLDEGPEFQGNVFGATGHTEHGPEEESFAEKMVDFHVAGADNPAAQAGRGDLEPDVGTGDKVKKREAAEEKVEDDEKHGAEEEQEPENQITDEPETIKSGDTVNLKNEEVTYKPPPISKLEFKNPTVVEFHSTRHDAEVVASAEDRHIASQLLNGGAGARGFQDVEGVTEDDTIDSGSRAQGDGSALDLDENSSTVVERSQGDAEDGKPLQVQIEPAPIAQPAEEEATTSAAADSTDERDEAQEPVNAPSFPDPPTEEPEPEVPLSASTQDTASASASTPVDPTFLKSFPDVPSESKPRVEVHVSSSPLSTPQKPALQTKSTDTPIAFPPGHSKSLSLGTFNPNDLDSPSNSDRRGSLEVDNTPRPLGGSMSAGNLAKRGSTRRSPKSPLLDDEDPGDFEPGEGWAVVTKWVVVVYLCCASFSWLMNPG